MTEYVLQDKSLAIKWALTFEDGQIDWSSTSNAASADIIVEDSVNAGVYWTISIDDGEFNWDLAGAQDDVVVIDDSVLTGESYRLYVSDGELEWLSYVLIEPSVLNTEGTLHAPQINLDVVVTPTVIDGRGALNEPTIVIDVTVSSGLLQAEATLLTPGFVIDAIAIVNRFEIEAIFYIPIADTGGVPVTLRGPLVRALIEQIISAREDVGQTISVR